MTKIINLKEYKEKLWTNKYYPQILKILKEFGDDTSSGPRKEKKENSK